MYVSNLVFLHSLYYFQAQILISFLCAGFPKFPSVINVIETNQSLIRFSGFFLPHMLLIVLVEGHQVHLTIDKK